MVTTVLFETSRQGVANMMVLNPEDVIGTGENEQLVFVLPQALTEGLLFAIENGGEANLHPSLLRAIRTDNRIYLRQDPTNRSGYAMVLRSTRDVPRFVRMAYRWDIDPARIQTQLAIVRRDLAR